MSIFRKEWVGGTKMFRRIDTNFVYEINEATETAVLEMEWAHEALAKPLVRFPNGKTNHEVANERIERGEDCLFDHLQLCFQACPATV